MSSEESPGTRVETHDNRDIIGSGPTISSLKFPEFHMFDSNWKLKLTANWIEELNTHTVSMRLRHRRRSVDDIWNLDASIRLIIDEEWLKCDVSFESNFSNRKREISLPEIGLVSDKLEGSNVVCHLNLFMQINSSSGIQLRNLVDFSRPLPIFSDAVVRIGDVEFYVNRMVLSMASPVFLRAFTDAVENGKNYIELCNVSPKDFRRILNMIYPPHLPPKQWIKENDIKKQLEHIYHMLNIAKVLEIPTVFEVADKFLVKYGRSELGDTLLVAQTFGLRELMGSELSKIRSIGYLKKRREGIESLNCKTKAMILDHLLFST
uniref:BTB domain-containing protein n=1 Tax=Caenorhabditis tropicalis TaxID=1561998 RepID=A0A1I7UCN9_9PELO